MPLEKESNKKPLKLYELMPTNDYYYKIGIVT